MSNLEYLNKGMASEGAGSGGQGSTDGTALKSNGTMTAKTAGEELLNGITFLHSVVRLLNLDTSTPVGKAILGLTIVGLIVQVAALAVLLATIFLNYDDPAKRRTVELLTRVATVLITIITVLDAVSSGLVAYASGSTTSNTTAP